MTPRTSLTHPLRIDALSCAPFASGSIGITFCPGKWGDSLYGAPWERDLDLDVEAIREWGASVALTLIEEHEFGMLRVPGLGEAFRLRKIEWYHLPVVDLRSPHEPFHAGWQAAGSAAVRALHAGGKVLVHCRGGVGRAGTVAALLLIELGANPAEALLRVRRVRPGAVETPAQERYVATYTCSLGNAGA